MKHQNGTPTGGGIGQGCPLSTYLFIIVMHTLFNEVESRRDEDIIKSVSQQLLPNDLGLYMVTENPKHRWLFRTPTLRNISLTAPYMHNGMFSNLDEVIRFYNKGYFTKN